MRTVGVRELKQALSKTLQDVGQGETVRVTSRGHPLADLVPAISPPGDDRLRELIIEGRLAPPTQGLPADQPPLVAAAHSASDMVLAEREEER